MKEPRPIRSTQVPSQSTIVEESAKQGYQGYLPDEASLFTLDTFSPA